MKTIFTFLFGRKFNFFDVIGILIIGNLAAYHSIFWFLAIVPLVIVSAYFENRLAETYE